MKNHSNYRSLGILAMLFYTVSCQKPDDLQKETVSTVQSHVEYEKNLVDDSVLGLYEVRGDILHFKDLKSYKETAEKLRQIKPQEQYQYWKNVNFSSYADEFLNVQLKLSKAKTKDEYDLILSENQDIIVLENGSPRPKAGDYFVNNFTNRQGLVFIGKILYKFDKYEQKIAFDGSKATIQKKVRSKALNIFDNVMSTAKNAKTQAICTSFYKRVQNGSGDRRVTVFSEVTYDYYYEGPCYGTSCYTVWWNFRVKGSSEKKNVWGNWVTYNATNTLAVSTTAYLTTGSNSPFPITLSCPEYSNEWHEITYDRYFDFTWTANPTLLLPNNTLHHFDDSYVNNGTIGRYSGSGVSQFYFACNN